MIWISPTERDIDAATLEKRLWDAADQFRANSGLKAQEYSGPILGLIFLRFAEVRYSVQRAKLEKAGASARRGSRLDEPAAYNAENILYLPAQARFDYLLNLPEAENIGAKVNAAMREIEKSNPQLAGVLPKTYNLFTSTLLKELLKKVSEIPATTDYDAFGRIYEYFLGEFARTEGQKGGEFYTPRCIVRFLTEVIEPYHGRILDPACGSGGMFVSSARFVAQHKKNPSAELSIHGVEKTDETGRLCRMNLAVHGLEGDIRHGGNVNSYYDDPHNATGGFDFVLANPPFNVSFRVPSKLDPHELYTQDMAAIVLRIVEYEGPIHEEEIVTRVRTLWSKGRAGSRIHDAVARAIRSLISSKSCVWEEGCLTIPGAKVRVRNRANAKSPTLRKPDHLPRIEVDAAILSVLEASHGAARSEIPTAVARLFGYQATSPQLKALIESQVAKLVQTGKLEEVNGMLKASSL